MQSVTSNAVARRLGDSQDIGFYSNYQSSHLSPNGNLQIHEVRNGVLYLNTTYTSDIAMTIPARTTLFTIQKVLTKNVIIGLNANILSGVGYIRASSSLTGRSDVVNINEITIPAGGELSFTVACPIG